MISSPNRLSLGTNQDLPRRATQCKKSRMNRTTLVRSLSVLIVAAAITPAFAKTRVNTAAAIPTTVLRIDGNTLISPDNVTQLVISRAGKDNLVGLFNICIDTKGDVADVTVLKSTSFEAYDAKIQREIRNWKYQPVVVEGKPTPTCTNVTLIYQQKQ